MQNDAKTSIIQDLGNEMSYEEGSVLPMTKLSCKNDCKTWIFQNRYQKIRIPYDQRKPCLFEKVVENNVLENNVLFNWQALSQYNNKSKKLAQKSI